MSPFPAPQQGHPPLTPTPAPASVPVATAAPVHPSHPKPAPFTPAAAGSKRGDELGMHCICAGLLCFVTLRFHFCCCQQDQICFMAPLWYHHKMVTSSLLALTPLAAKPVR